MGIFKSLKGDKGVNDRAGNQATYHTRYDEHSTASEKRQLFSPSPSTPTTTQSSSKGQSYAPPPGPRPRPSPTDNGPQLVPPSNPPPYHDWTVIPDTSLLPPPPSISHINSPANNASYDEAARAHDWCAHNPHFSPSTPSPPVYQAVQQGDLSFERPREYAGELKKTSRGVWGGKTRSSCTDAILLSNLPLYFAAPDSPLHTEHSKTIYYELKIHGIRNSDSGIAIGYAAKPYPPWRLPGWHRASLGVHGDDGRRFVNDSWGGLDFVEPFKVGDVVGVGMTFHASNASHRIAGSVCVWTEAFFLRNGREEGRWAIDEERDAERDEGIEGLQGELDIYAAIGVFGEVEFEIVTSTNLWMNPPG